MTSCQRCARPPSPPPKRSLTHSLARMLAHHERPRSRPSALTRPRRRSRTGWLAIGRRASTSRPTIPKNETVPETTRLTAFVTRDGRWWAVCVPEVDGLLTQARTLAEVPAQVLDAAELLTDRPASHFDVVVARVDGPTWERI